MGADFKIVLNGTNKIDAPANAIEMKRDQNGYESENKSDLLLTGYGSLETIGTIDGGESIVIKNCNLNIYSEDSGINGERSLHTYLINAKVDITINKVNGENVFTGGILGTYLTVNNSNVNIFVKTFANDFRPPHPINLKKDGYVQLNEDQKVTNNKGELLYLRNLGEYLVYTKYETGSIDYTMLSETVSIESASKTQEMKVVNHAIALINQIGTVTNQSGEAIRTARAAYDALSDDLKLRITNIAILTEAESTYEKAVQEAVNEVIELINAIGTVDINSEEKIKQAQEAYNKLPEDQKSQVTNVDILNTAQITYQQVVAKAAEEKKLEEEKKKAEEEKKKAEEEKKKSENKKQTDKKTSSKVTVKKTKITYLKSKKKNQLTVKWNKDKTCKGYQIAYSTNQKFKNAKFKIIKKWKTNTYTIKNLKSKKYYYVRIREYKVVKGKKVFGKWCKVRKVKIK